MTIEETFRSPTEIISDLLWFAEMDLTDLKYPERYDEVKAEAKAYLNKVNENRKAWKRIEDLHKTSIFDRWDTGL